MEALPGRELESLLGPLAATRDQVHWCHLPASRRPREAGGPRRQVALAAPAAARRQQRAIRDRQLNELTDFPRALAKPPRRWVASGGWTPPETVPLVRFRDPHDGRYVLSIQPGSPAGCELDHHLGVVQRFSPPGTVRLEFHDGDYRTLERGSPHGEDPTVVELGHIECAPLPLLLPLLLATHLASGQRVLLGGFEDPLAGACEIHGGIGFLEGLPVLPRGVPVARDSDYGLRGLLRVLDGARRVHVYAIDHVPTGGRLVGELGGLLAGYQEQSIPLWIGPDGLVHTDGYRPRSSRRPTPSPSRAGRPRRSPGATSAASRGACGASAGARSTSRASCSGIATGLRRPAGRHPTPTATCSARPPPAAPRSGPASIRSPATSCSRATSSRRPTWATPT